MNPSGLVRHRRRILGALALCASAAVVALVPASASAECRSVYQADLQGGFALICDGTNPGGGGGSRAPKKDQQATRAQLAKLRFTASSAAAVRARAKLADALATTGEQSVDAEIRRVTTSGTLSAQIRGLMRKAGLSTSDIGDYYTFAYITGWQVTHEGRSVSDATAAAVRRELRSRVARNATLRRMTNAQKQEYAERLAGWLSVLTGTWNDAKSTGKAGLVENAVDSMWARLAEKDLLGAYVNAAKLTRSGVSEDYGPFVP